MNDDEMDELMARAARDYNAPGEAPREEMWSRIEAVRRERRQPRAVAVVSRNRWALPGVGIAAAAVLALGISLGRKIERANRASPSASASLAAKSTPVLRGDTGSTPAIDAAAAPNRAGTDSLVARIHDQTKATDRRARQLASIGSDSASTPRGVDSGVSARRDDESMRLAYRLVMLQHIAGSEAMITAFRASARRGEVDAQMAQWARELLGTTRLLESSPAADDPTMRRLLQDLDLVIAQIVQYASHGTTNPEELDLIERSIQRRGIMTKLRSTTSSRVFTAGT